MIYFQKKKKEIECIERKTKLLKWFSENLKINLSYVRNNQACHTLITSFIVSYMWNSFEYNEFEKFNISTHYIKHV